MPATTTHRLTTGADALTKLLPPIEAEIMRLIWREGYRTVKEVHRIRTTQRELAYTSTMTTMERLAIKGLLNRSKRDGSVAYTYTATQSEAAFVAGRLADILSAVERDYPSVLGHVLGKEVSDALT